MTTTHAIPRTAAPVADRAALCPPTRYTAVPVTTLADGQELVLPVHRLEGGAPGPTLGLIALLHGDETLSHEIVRRVLVDVPVADLRGTIVAVPAAYGPALEALTRNSPIDMLDLNRSFPGDPDGWLTEQLAHVITEHFLPELDYLLDLHSAGIFPTVDYVYVADGERELALALSLGCEHVYVAAEPHLGGLAGFARTRGITTAMLEIGGGLVADEPLVEKGVSAVLGALRHTRMLSAEPEPPRRQVVFEEMAWLRPRAGGILYPAVGVDRLGTTVGRDELLGRVVNPLTYEVVEELRCPFHRGLLVLLRASLSRVNPGDFAYMLGNAESEREP